MRLILFHKELTSKASSLNQLVYIGPVAFAEFGTINIMNKLQQNIGFAILISLLVGASLGYLITDNYLSTNEEDNTTDELLAELIRSNNKLETTLIAVSNKNIEATNILNNALYSINDSLGDNSNANFNKQLIDVLQKIANYTCLDARYDAVGGAYYSTSSYFGGGKLVGETRINNTIRC